MLALVFGGVAHGRPRTSGPDVHVWVAERDDDVRKLGIQTVRETARDALSRSPHSHSRSRAAVIDIAVTFVVVQGDEVSVRLQVVAWDAGGRMIAVRSCTARARGTADLTQLRRDALAEATRRAISSTT